jgi:hypothetical protein
MKRLILLVVLAIPTVAFSQDATLDLTGEDPAPAAKKPVSAPATILTSGVKAVFCIICDAEPSKFIILDQDGQWVPDVHSAVFTFEPNKTAEITCTIWVGPYKPTKPTEKTWKLEQMMTVPKDQFSKYVDELQADPKAVAKTLGG